MKSWNERIRYYIYGVHKRYGTFNEWSYNENLAKAIAIDLVNSEYFTYVSVNPNYPKKPIESK